MTVTEGKGEQTERDGDLSSEDIDKRLLVTVIAVGSFVFTSEKSKKEGVGLLMELPLKRG